MTVKMLMADGVYSYLSGLLSIGASSALDVRARAPADQGRRNISKDHSCACLGYGKAAAS